MGYKKHIMSNKATEQLGHKKPLFDVPKPKPIIPDNKTIKQGQTLIT